MVAAIAVVALLSWKAEPTQSAATVPQGFTDTLIAQMNNPTAMAIAPDGRLFVAQKANNNVGKLRVIKNNQLLSKHGALPRSVPGRLLLRRLLRRMDQELGPRYGSEQRLRERDSQAGGPGVRRQRQPLLS